jgi:hypothetical protein
MDAGEVRLSSWDIMNVRVGCRFKSFTVHLGMDNVFDRKYTVANSYEWDVIGGPISRSSRLFQYSADFRIKSIDFFQLRFIFIHHSAFIIFPILSYSSRNLRLDMNSPKDFYSFFKIPFTNGKNTNLLIARHSGRTIFIRR